MKILITGGHSTPALAICDRLKKNKKIKIVFVGRRYSDRRKRDESFEYLSVRKMGLPFRHIETGRLTRIMSFSVLWEMSRVPLGIWQAYKILATQKSERVLSFGGYVALPVAIAARCRGIPVVTHEQTLVPGLANRIIARLARRVLVTFESTRRYFNNKRVVVTGNPIRASVFEKNPVDYLSQLPTRLPLIYVSGGSLGSRSLNSHMERIIEKLTRRYIVLHQCGSSDDSADFVRLSRPAGERYIVRKHIFDAEIGTVLDRAQVVVCRSGANTVMELIALKKPAVLIPLPWSAGGEQRQQARMLERAHVGEIFDQEHPSDELLDKIESVMARRGELRKNFMKLQHYYKKDASERIIAELLKA